MNKEPDLAIKVLAKDIADNAQWNRLLNTMQCDKEGCVDYNIFVDIGQLKTMLFWDIFEYLTNSEWGTTIEERLKKFKDNPSNNVQSEVKK
jgi:hypothetical protein